MEHYSIHALRREFIGKECEVKGKNVHGTIIDETKNTFIIQTKNNARRIGKRDNAFIIDFRDQKIEIPGQQIMLRPEDRIKIRKWK